MYRNGDDVLYNCIFSRRSAAKNNQRWFVYGGNAWNGNLCDNDFAVLFLFYTNSFLMKRRKKEFGLYNVLGMGKGNLARILFWESVQIAFISLTAGLMFGIVFAKLGELAMMYAIKGENNYNITVNTEALFMTLKVFGVIYVLLFVNMVRQVRMSKPVDLLRSENRGEKPPKANWFIALCGVVILAGAYYIAVTIEEPLSALSMFLWQL